MKRIIVYALFNLVVISLSFAQIGINTETPLDLFHIDTSTGAVNLTTDDFRVDALGNVALGTQADAIPYKIRIVSPTQGEGFQLQDGSQTAGRVLTSDAQGKARWATPVVTASILGDIGASVIKNGIRVRASDVDRIAYSGMSITLDPGDYLVNFTLWFGAAGAAVEMDNIVSDKFASIFFSTSDTEHMPPAYITDIKSIIVPGLFHRAKKLDYYGSGTIPIRISGQRTTLYLWAYIRTFNYKPANATFPDANPDSNRQIQFFNQTEGSFGPYTQLYAIPLVPIVD